ncbi:DUF3375 family protein [Mangrovimicrobium sediminis]|nr:DUF3375 family protein [Haliea sp. SAOS-164]
MSAEDPSWVLLRSSNAWWILAFLQDAFEESREQELPKIYVRLEGLIGELRAAGRLGDSDTSARHYVREWVRYGWVREESDKIMPTDAFETAIRFATSMNKKQRDSGASAGHLSVVQSMAASLAIELSPNIEQKRTQYQAQIAELELKLSELDAGLEKRLSPARHREGVRNLYKQAMLLSRDFSLIHDDHIDMDREMRRRIAEEGGGRGVAMQARLEGEQALSASESGQAFEGFYDLLSNSIRADEFNDRLLTICQYTPDEYLSPEQKKALTRLQRNLNQESQRVFTRRKTINQNFRAFLEAGVGGEKHRMDELFEEFSSVSQQLFDHGVRGGVDTGYTPSTGKMERTTPLSGRAQGPESVIDTSSYTVAATGGEITDELAAKLRGVNQTKIARRLATLLDQHGPMSISDVAEKQPITRGLEEALTYIRIALKYQAPLLEGEDIIEFSNGDRRYLGYFPRYWFSRDIMPVNSDEILI